MNRLGMILALAGLLFSGWFATTTRGDINPPNSVTSSAEFPDWLKNGSTVVGLVAGPGIAVWYLWYDTTRVKPKLQKDFREQMEVVIQRYTLMAKETEERHASHWTLANNNSRADLHEMMKGWREDMSGLKTAIERLSETASRNECQYEPSRRNAG